MIAIKDKKKAKRHNIHLRIRKKVKGTAERPRLSLCKTNRAIYAQLIDDQKGHTLVAANSRGLKGKNISHAIQTAEELTKKALSKNISQIVFDRSGYRYHGVVKEFSKTVNKHGLKH